MSSTAVAPASEGFSVLSPNPVGGRRRMSRKLRVTKKKIAQLKKYAKKLGGEAEKVEEKAEAAADAVDSTAATLQGARRRRRGTRKTRKHRRALFGLKY